MKVVEARRSGAARNDLLDRLAADPLFASVKARIHAEADPARHVGRAPEQVEAFLREELEPALSRGGSPEPKKIWEVKV